MPQSNQRGIENRGTWSTRRSSSCLNRTSVGLKRSRSFLFNGGWGAGLNRTSVGLKTSPAAPPRARLTPSLNRTSVGLKSKLLQRLFELVFESLNRTSVGLKSVEPPLTLAVLFVPQSNQRGIEKAQDSVAPQLFQWPQSNQRGIEKSVVIAVRSGRLLSLNRTSVGLKSLQPGGPLPGRPEPQSNQRGIEKPGAVDLPQTGAPASIEPAWD